MASSVFYNGRRYTTPTTVSQVSDEKMAPRTQAVGNNLALVGTSGGGQPKTPFTVQSPEDLKRKVRSGDLLVGGRKSFGPTPIGAPRTIHCVRVGTATRATLVLKDGSAADTVKLTSRLWGNEGNATFAKVENGTLRGKKLTVQLENVYTVGDNLARDAFKVRYTGSETAATLDITAGQALLKHGATVAATIDLADFPTVQHLCDRINATPGFSASAAPNATKHPTANALDFITGADVKTADYTAKADLQAMVDWLNSAASELVEGERVAGSGKVPANAAARYLAGAADPAPTMQDWADAIDALETVDCQHIVPLSDDPAVHAMVEAHVIFMSTAGRKERRATVGGPAGLTLAAAKPLAAALGNDRMTFAWPAHYDYDLLGNRTLLPGYMTAAVIGAARAGVNPGVSLTNKPVNVDALEFLARNPTDTDEAIQAGILVIELTEEDGFKVVRDISTWLASDNYNRVENATGTAIDYVARSCRKVVDHLRGEKAGPALMAEGLSLIKSQLTYLAKPEPIGMGILVGDEKSPPFRNLSASTQGDVTQYFFECSPVVPNNFQLIGISVSPYSGVATIAV